MRFLTTITALSGLATALPSPIEDLKTRELILVEGLETGGEDFVWVVCEAHEKRWKGHDALYIPPLNLTSRGPSPHFLFTTSTVRFEHLFPICHL